MKKNMLSIFILAICISMICISSVSAVDNGHVDSTIEIANENSHVDNVVNDVNDTSDAGDGNSVEEMSLVGVGKNIDGANSFKVMNDDDIIVNAAPGQKDIPIDNLGVPVVINASCFDDIRGCNDFGLDGNLQKSIDSSFDIKENSYHQSAADGSGLIEDIKALGQDDATESVCDVDADDSAISDIDYLNGDFSAASVNGNVLTSVGIIDKRVYDEREVSIFVDRKQGRENSIVNINPFIVDGNCIGECNVISGGILKIYSDGQMKNLVAEFDLDNCTSFNHTVLKCPDSLNSYEYSIWYGYEKYDYENFIHYYSNGCFKFNSINTNSLNITVKGSKSYRVIDGILNVYEGDSIVVSLADIRFWDPSGSHIKVYVKGKNGAIASFGKWDKECEIKLNVNDFPAGEYVVYAVYEGYSYDYNIKSGRFFAPAVSNEVPFIVNPKNFAVSNIAPVADVMTCALSSSVSVDSSKRVFREVFIYADCKAGMENSMVKIDLMVLDRNSNPVTDGVVKVYSDYQRNDLIAVVDLANGTSFHYTIPECPDSVNSYEYAIWYTYEKFDEKNDVTYYCGDHSFFNTVNTNSLNISVKGSKNYKVLNGTLNVLEGDSIIVSLADIRFWDPSDSRISVFVMGKNGPIASFDKWRGECEIKLDVNDFPAGEYVIYAIYRGQAYDFYMKGGSFFAPAVSNKIPLKINARNLAVSSIAPVADVMTCALSSSCIVDSPKRFYKNVFIFSDGDKGLENSVVRINLTALDIKGNPIKEGIVKVYEDVLRLNLVAVVDLANCSSFDYKVRECPDFINSYEYSIWYDYERYDEQNNTIYFGHDSSRFSTVNTNSISISAKGSKAYAIINETVHVMEGESIVVCLDNIRFWDSFGSPVNVYVEGKDGVIASFSKLKGVYEIKLDANDFPAGEYVIYAVYDGYSNGCKLWEGRYFAPATSNKISLKVHSKVSDAQVPSSDIPANALMLSACPKLDNGPKVENVGVFFDLKYALENSKVNVTPVVFDRNYNIISGGILKVYSDYHRTNLIACIDLERNSSFEYTVPECPSGSSEEYHLFYTYEKYDPISDIEYREVFDFFFKSMNTNNFTISVKDSKGQFAENGTLEIKQGESVNIVVDHLDYKTGHSNIKIYVEGVDEQIGGFAFDYATHEVTLDEADFPAGEYVIYAAYDGYVQDGNYFAPAVSNKVVIKINPDEPNANAFDILMGIADALKSLEVPA